MRDRSSIYFWLKFLSVVLGTEDLFAGVVPHGCVDKTPRIEGDHRQVPGETECTGCPLRSTKTGFVFLVRFTQRQNNVQLSGYVTRLLSNPPILAVPWITRTGERKCVSK